MGRWLLRHLRSKGRKRAGTRHQRGARTDHPSARSSRSTGNYGIWDEAQKDSSRSPSREVLRLPATRDSPLGAASPTSEARRSSSALSASTWLGRGARLRRVLSIGGPHRALVPVVPTGDAARASSSRSAGCTVRRCCGGRSARYVEFLARHAADAPALLHLLLPAGGRHQRPRLLAAIWGLAINYSAYEAEIYRAGLLAIPTRADGGGARAGMSRRAGAAARSSCRRRCAS